LPLLQRYVGQRFTSQPLDWIAGDAFKLHFLRFHLNNENRRLIILVTLH
jgi:hypothetical protein